MNLKNNLRRAWQWLWGNTFIAIKLQIGTFRNNWAYREICRKADLTSQKLNWQRIYIFPNPKDKPGFHLVSSSMIAEENRHRSKKLKLDVRALCEHSYGWADKNTSALENFYRGRPRKQKKADRIGKKATKLRKITVHEPGKPRGRKK